MLIFTPDRVPKISLTLFRERFSFVAITIQGIENKRILTFAVKRNADMTWSEISNGLAHTYACMTLLIIPARGRRNHGSCIYFSLDHGGLRE